MNTGEFSYASGQGHSVIVNQGPSYFNNFFVSTAKQPIDATFHWNLQWVKEIKFCLKAVMSIYDEQEKS